MPAHKEVLWKLRRPLKANTADIHAGTWKTLTRNLPEVYKPEPNSNIQMKEKKNSLQRLK